MNESPFPHGLVGGVGMTEVRVYDQRAAPDGLFSGCPHVHAICDEGYYVLSGRGWAEFHDTREGYRKLELAPGDYLHFPPQTLHRLVSAEALVILGIMANSGLAERGEARIYFGPEVDAAPARFAGLMSLPRLRGLAGALERRDAAVEAYRSLLALWENDRPAYFAELERFFAVHRAAMAARADEFREEIERGPGAWVRMARERLEALPQTGGCAGRIALNRRGDEEALGMCGVLRPMLRLRDPAPAR